MYEGRMSDTWAVACDDFINKVVGNTSMQSLRARGDHSVTDTERIPRCRGACARSHDDILTEGNRVGRFASVL